MQCPSLGKEKNTMYFEHFLTDPIPGPKYFFLCSESHKVPCENSPWIFLFENYLLLETKKLAGTGLNVVHMPYCLKFPPCKSFCTKTLHEEDYCQMQIC